MLTSYLTDSPGPPKGRPSTAEASCLEPVFATRCELSVPCRVIQQRFNVRNALRNVTQRAWYAPQPGSAALVSGQRIHDHVKFGVFRTAVFVRRCDGNATEHTGRFSNIIGSTPSRTEICKSRCIGTIQGQEWHTDARDRPVDGGARGETQPCAIRTTFSCFSRACSPFLSSSPIAPSAPSSGSWDGSPNRPTNAATSSIFARSIGFWPLG